MNPPLRLKPNDFIHLPSKEWRSFCKITEHRVQLLPVLYAEMPSRHSGQNDWSCRWQQLYYCLCSRFGQAGPTLLVYINIEDNLCGCPLRYKINSSLLFFEKLFQELVHLFVKVLQKILTQDECVIIDNQQVDN